MADTPALPVAGAAVVCLRTAEVLLVQRGREPNRGRWSFPGGKIEPGETARQAAEREALEETGLHVRVLDVVDVYDAIFPPFHFCVADYLAVPEDDAEPVAGGDAMDAQWVPFHRLDDYNLTEAMCQVLERARWMMSVHRQAPPSLGTDLETVPPGGIGGGSGATVPNELQELLELPPDWHEDPPLLVAADRSHLQGLYVITDDTLPAGRTHLEIAGAALEGGARIVQLRDKRRDAGELLPIAHKLRSMCHEAGGLFIVNDRVDLALACEADGVHLGQTDLPVREARLILGPEKLVGISVENEEQVRAAEEAGADYLGVGAIYGSATKLDAGDAVGLAQITRFRAISRLPIVAIGGITLERVPEVRAAGADSVAVIGAVASAPDAVDAARALADAFLTGGSE